MKRFILLTLVFGLLAGCGKNDASGDGADGKRVIAVIPKGTSHEFWKAVHAGALDAAKESDVEIRWDGPESETEIDRQRAIVEAMVNKKVDAIALAPLDEQAMKRPAQQAMKRGIPLIVFDSNLAGEGYVSFVATDNLKGGKLGGERMVASLGDKSAAKLFMLRYTEGSGSTRRREQGFEEAVTAKGHAIVESQFTDGSQEGAQKTAENILRKYVEGDKLLLDGVYASNQPTSLAMLEALNRLSNGGVDVSDTIFIGFDSSDKLVEAVDAGRIDALVVQNPKRMGYLAVKSLIDNLDGKDVPARVDTGVEVVSKDRLSEPAIRSLLGLE